tara:strand:+ start:369 stop:767 length:399 start_codon:yes stop_codon:yes gene_type:complete
MKILLKKNIKAGKINTFNFSYFTILFICIYFYHIINLGAVELKILDKVSSKSSQLKVEINTEKKFKNLKIKVLKCENSKYDDDPEVTAYLQVIDSDAKNNDKVFVFNGWTFASSPSLRPFDHPVYDIWLISC